MAKATRDWAQLDAFEAEYADRLADEKKHQDTSQFLDFLRGVAEGRDDFRAEELKPRDDQTGRLFALRGKIFSLREKLGLDDVPLLDSEKPLLSAPQPKANKPNRIRFIVDAPPPGYTYPVNFDEIRALLAELPQAHVATVHEVRLSSQRKTGADGDWLDGEIRLHCLGETVSNEQGELAFLRRQMGRREGGQDVQRFGGNVEWINNTLYAVWPLAAYKTFVLRRVLVHEVAHGVAELPGYSDAVHRAGSVERFCEQYAEKFYRPPGRSVRLNY